MKLCHQKQIIFQTTWQKITKLVPYKLLNIVGHYYYLRQMIKNLLTTDFTSLALTSENVTSLQRKSSKTGANFLMLPHYISSVSVQVPAIRLCSWTKVIYS